MAKSDLLLHMLASTHQNREPIADSDKLRLALAIADELPEAELDELAEYIMSEAIPRHLSRRIADNAGGGK